MRTVRGVNFWLISENSLLFVVVGSCTSEVSLLESLSITDKISAGESVSLSTAFVEEDTDLLLSLVPELVSTTLSSTGGRGGGGDGISISISVVVSSFSTTFCLRPFFFFPGFSSGKGICDTSAAKSADFDDDSTDFLLFLPSPFADTPDSSR